ncbi:MAG: phenylalanine--tRNA ligase subunit beta, partial [Clostridia bacterium]|nr:phenylalanine--tRNA ligase subunit beta [Clostridia bacterium]
LSGAEINVRRAKDGEKIITLDEKEFSLTSENLVICDKDKPVALAGVMGGLNSEIKETTKDVVFESARFKRDNIRKTARKLGQKSDSSSRFEKGVDFYSVETGMARALNLIEKTGSGEIASDGYDLIEKPIEKHVIKTTFSKINAVLGIEVDKNTVKEILERLFFTVNISGEELICEVPLFREDMESYPDIAEEIIREYGYSHIVPTLLKTSSITSGGLSDEQKKIEKLKGLLVGFGFNEAITYSFVSEKEYDLFGFDKDSAEHKFIKIMNPLGEDMAVMRTSLIPSLVRAACFNINRKNYSGRLFELAKIYNSDEDTLTKLPKETEMLTFVQFGEDEDFFTLKGTVEGILDEFCFGKETEFVMCDLPFMHPTRSAFVIVEGEKVGCLGEVNPILMEKLDVAKPVYVCEINYESLSRHFADRITVKPISKYPIVERDLAITVSEDVLWGDVVKVVKNSAGEFLNSVKLFDIYRSAVLGDKKSMAFNMVFVSYERTLTVEEIDAAIKNVLKNLKDKLGAELR